MIWNQSLSIVSDILQILANLIVVITIWFLIQQTRATLEGSKEAQLLRVAEIYRSINLQFDEIISHLPPEINDFPDLSTLRRKAKKPGFTPGQAERAIWRYYEMVRMEFELCRMGMLTNHIWKSWLLGIISSFRYPAFQEVWDKEYTIATEKNTLIRQQEFLAFMELAKDKPETLVEECGTVQGLMNWAERHSNQ